MLYVAENRRVERGWPANTIPVRIYYPAIGNTEPAAYSTYRRWPFDFASGTNDVLS